jgi:hypothetical protein
MPNFNHAPQAPSREADIFAVDGTGGIRRISNERIAVLLDESHGRLLQIFDRHTQIALIAESQLADNLRLLVPLPGNRGYTVQLAKVPVSRIHQDAAGLHVVWDSLPTPQGQLAIAVTLTIALLPDGVQFVTTVRHAGPADIVVEEVHTPVLGGLGERAAAQRGNWVFHQPETAGLGREIRPYADVSSVYLGPVEPTSVHPVRCMGWVDLYNRELRHGVYLCCEDPASAFGAWMSQAMPGADWGGHNWNYPRDQRPQGYALAWVAFPHIAAGTTWTSAPVVLRFHTGTWYQATRLYREFYDRHWNIDRSRSWLWLEDAWQSTIISYPDDTIGYRFADLPELARQAVAAGIRVLQIDGWDVGGIDRSYPHYTPDPRLGTPEALRNAIAECERLGCRVLLFSNLHQVNLETEWYAQELHRYTIRNAYNQIPSSMGWEYNTAGGLLGLRKPLMVDCNPAHPGFGAIMDQAYRTIAELGAAGSQVDKIQVGPTLDFNPDLPRDLPRAASWNTPTLQAFARHAAIGQAIRKDYALASESHWDRLFPLVEVAYARHWYADQPQSCGATFPEYKQTCCITGPTDYRLVNNCLRLGLVINLEAQHLHAGSAAVPLLIPHIKKVRALRKKLWHLLWLGRLEDPHDCLKDADDGLLISRWVAQNGASALVLNHYHIEKPLKGTVSLPGFTQARIHHLDGTEELRALPAEITVPIDEPVVVEGIPN